MGKKQKKQQGDDDEKELKTNSVECNDVDEEDKKNKGGNSDGSNNDNDIERLREKKRLKKNRQKEKKLAKQENEQLRQKQKMGQQKKKRQDDEKKKRKLLLEKSAASMNGGAAFVKAAMGVQYRDVVVGTGPVIVDRKRLVCSYVLRSKNIKNGKVLDKGDRFSFRYGKGEVIRGWEIGLGGMKRGGTRHIIVPPDAGYGKHKDIGGGKGATLYFEVTLLQC